MKHVNTMFLSTVKLTSNSSVELNKCSAGHEAIFSFWFDFMRQFNVSCCQKRLSSD